jgi:hypothetical protein
MVKVSLLLCALALCAVFSACRAITLVEEDVDGPARMPADGLTYTFAYQASGSTDSTIERVTISLIAGEDFIAKRSIDTAFVSADTFHVRDDGDLEAANENEVYPVGTLGSYVITQHAQTFVNGKQSEASIESEFRYDGTDRLKVGDSTYLCSRIKAQCSIMPENGSPNKDATVTYWYSSKLAYFVLIRSNSSSDKDLNFERRLRSVK